MSELVHPTKKLLNIIPYSCPNHAIYIDSFTLKENQVTIKLDYLYQDNTYLTNCPGNDGRTKFHSYSNKSAFKSYLIIFICVIFPNCEF